MTSELTKALVEFHKTVGTINKTAKSYTNEYAPLSEVLSVVTPALSAQGLTFTHSFEPTAEGQEPLLVCTLLHTSGETLQSKLPLVVAKGKNAVQDLGSSITYLKRYTLLAILGIVADVDTDGNTDQPSSETKPEPKAKPAKKQEAPKPEPKPAPVAEPADKPVDAPLSSDDRTLLIQCLKELSSDSLASVVDAFKTEFGLAPDAKLKTEMTTEKHAIFLRAQLASLS